MQFSWQGGQDEGLEEELEGMSEVEVWKERPHGNISFTLSTFDSAEKKNFHSRPIAEEENGLAAALKPCHSVESENKNNTTSPLEHCRS